MNRDERIESNLGLVHTCAKRFIGKGIEYDDLYSAGCVGLVKAVDRFDNSLGYQFSTYAVPVILGEIRLLFREGGSIKLSRSLQELSIKARKITEEYRDQHDEDITITELAAQLGTDIYHAQEALNAARTVLSLSRDSDGDENDFDIPVPSAENELTDHLSLEQAISNLDTEEQNLIRLRYYQNKTQSETAKALNTTQVQISRREKKILTKMRMMLL